MGGKAEESIGSLLQERGIGEVPICDIDRAATQLVDGEGRRYREVATNLWIEAVPGTFFDVVYLGTGRHGGGIVLRPLFAKEDGRWRNVSTGALAPAGLQAAFDEAHGGVI